jgi:hypothetical protein
MRKRFVNLVLIAGLAVAAGAWSQEHEPRVDAPAMNPRMTLPEREPSMRQDAPMRESLRAPSQTNTFPQRPGGYNERLGPRESLFNERARSQLRQQQLRDPRQMDYRIRGWSEGPNDRSVPRDMQRAIERAQSEHGGKVLSADRIRYRGQDTYRVKLLTPNGRVRVVQLSQAPEGAAPEAESRDQRNGDE